MKKYLPNGFTLIELLVAISIVSILSIIGFVSFQNVQKNAKDAKIKADLIAIQKAYEVNYSLSANNGQGGYIALTPSQFANNQIPKKPDNTDYTYDYGPNASDPKYDGYRVSAQTSDGKTVTAVSNQGTASTSQLNSCDPTNSLANGLVGYWKIDEAANSWNGTNGEVKDYTTVNSGKSVNILANSNPTAGNFSNAVNFTGQVGNSVTTNKYIQIARNPILEPSSALSISLWMKSSGQLSGIFGRLLSHGYEIVNYHSGAGGNIQFALNTTGPSAGVKNIQSNTNNPIANHPSGNLADGNWYFIVATWDGTTMKLYVNGIQQTQTTTATGTASYNTSNNIRLGVQEGSSTSTSWPYTGYLDDVRIYNRALGQADIDLLRSGCALPQ